MEDVVIVSAARTPVGSFNGAFASVPAHELGRTAIKEALARAHVDGKDVSETILGQILTAAQGQNPARQASMNAGVPFETPAWIVNQLCGSGLRAVALGYQQVALICLGLARQGVYAPIEAPEDAVAEPGVEDVFEKEHVRASVGQRLVVHSVIGGETDRPALRCATGAKAAASCESQMRRVTSSTS